nr:G protein-coupled receptor [Proales similis]
MRCIILIVLAVITESKSETCSFDKKSVSMQRPNIYLSCRIGNHFTEIMEQSSTRPSKYGFFYTVQEMYFYVGRALILDESLSLKAYLESLIMNNLTIDIFHFGDLPWLSLKSISLINIKGIDIDHSYSIIGNLSGSQNQLTIEFDYSHFLPFSNNRKLLGHCEKESFGTSYLSELVSLELRRLVFKTGNRYYRNVCSIFFKNAAIFQLELKGIGSSFLGDNSLTFDYFTENGTNAGLNASIRNLVLNLYLDRIDSGILNDQVLENMQSIQIYGKLNKIEPCLFQFYNRIYLHIVNLKEFIHSGIKWCLDRDSKNEVFFININKIGTEKINKRLSESENTYTFPIEDICLYRSLFSDGRHYFLFETFQNEKCSCSIFWLVHNYKNGSDELSGELYTANDMFSICTENKTYDEWMEECDFDSRFAKCDLNQSTRAEAEWTAFDTAFLVAGFKYAFAVVLLPIVCVIGLVTSCLSIAVLRKMIAKLAEKRYDDTSKRSRLMYSYLLQHAVGSAAVCALFTFKPLTDCVSFGGIFCSPVYTSWHTRLFEAIGLNLLGTALKLHTTTTALLFSLARLAINVKNKKRRSIRVFSKMRPAYVSLACFLVSLLLSSVKLFTSNDYSVLSWTGDIFISFKIPSFSTFQIYYSNFIASEAFYYLNLGLEIILDLLIPLLTVLIDLVLLKVMRQQNVNRSKMSKQLQTKSEENEKQFTKMIIFNGVFNFIFRIPVLTSNILEFIVFNQFGFYFYNFQSCQFDDYPLLSLCPSILSISNMLLKLGYLIDFCLLVKFNKDFRTILLEYLQVIFPTRKQS